MCSTWSSTLISKLFDDVSSISPFGKVTKISGQVETVLRLQESSDQARKQLSPNNIHRKMQASRHHPTIPQIPYPKQRMFRTNCRSQFPVKATEGGIVQGKQNEGKTLQECGRKEDCPEEQSSIEAHPLNHSFHPHLSIRN